MHSDPYLTEAQARRLNELLEAKRRIFRDALQGAAASPKFRNMAELNAALDKQRAAAKAKQVDPKKRITEIETELDIIRGVVPTPAGYKVDTTKVKKLAQELTQLKSSDRR